MILDKISSIKTFCLVSCKIYSMDKKFCENLKEIRKASGLTQKQVAGILNVVDSCYANWEQGRTEPNIEMLRKLSKLFYISLDELINGN